MRILSIDTSTSETSVSISADGAIVASISQTPHPSHSRNLLLLVKNTLEKAGLSIGEMDAFAVACGPGSFTGLRIGVSSAMGIGDALGKPVAGVGSMEAIAVSHGPAEKGFLCPILNARQGEVYAALFGFGGKGMTRVTEDMALPPEELAGMLNGPVTFVGEGFAPYEQIFRGQLSEVEVFQKPARPVSEGVAACAFDLASMGLLEKSAPSPKYVKRSQAEINWEQLHTKQ